MWQQLKSRAMLTAAIHRVVIRRIPPLPPPPRHRRCFCSLTSIDYPPLQHQLQWSGLHNWRRSPLNRDREWGPNGPIHEHNEIEDTTSSPDFCSCSSLAEMAGVVLSTSDPLAKAKLSHAAYAKWRREGLPIGLSDPPSSPARPAKPQLVYCFDWSGHLISVSLSLEILWILPNLCLGFVVIDEFLLISDFFKHKWPWSSLCTVPKIYFFALSQLFSERLICFWSNRSCILMEIVCIFYKFVFVIL